MIFLFPTEAEAAMFRAACSAAEVVVCGVGMAAAGATMARLAATRDSIEMVVLAGIAGSYDLSKLALNEVVEVVSEQIEELPTRFRKEYNSAPRFGLPTAISNTVSSSNFVGAKSDIENMEGAAVMAICEALQIPCAEIRAISNLVGDDFERWSVDSALQVLTDRLTTIYNG